jgi:hypothetical protein
MSDMVEMQSLPSVMIDTPANGVTHLQVSHDMIQ